MSEIAKSPGLAIGQAAPTPIAPDKEPKRTTRMRKKKTVVTESAQSLNRMTLAQRAATLDRRKRQQYPLTVKLDEEIFAALVALCERANLKPKDAAVRCIREGLRRYADLPIRELPGSDGIDAIPLGEELPVLFDTEAAGYRRAVETPEEQAAKKNLLRAIGVQMS